MKWVCGEKRGRPTRSGRRSRAGPRSSRGRFFNVRSALFGSKGTGKITGCEETGDPHVEDFRWRIWERCHKNIHKEGAQAQKERGPISRSPLKKCLFIRFQLAEVALQQALERLAVTGPPHGAGPVGTPSGSKCSAEVNSAISALRAALRAVALRNASLRLGVRQDFCQRQKCLLTRPATEKIPPAVGRGNWVSISRSSASAGPRRPCRDGPRRGPSRARCRGWRPG